MRTHSLVSILGPTGVGKSDCSLLLADYCKSSLILNGDMGQLYTPLSCGTAKPDWKNSPTPHALFDVLNEPEDFSAVQYRSLVSKQLEQCIAQRAPILVGGSLFYHKVLFFRPQGFPQPQRKDAEINVKQDPQLLWQELFIKDPQRAQALHPHDAYRITRALSIARTQRPSACGPLYDPLCTKTLFIHITRDRDELYDRINARVDIMLDAGWMDEVAGLHPAWHLWLKRKKLIGYNELIELIESGSAYSPAISTTWRERIKQRTRNYAKRQLTLWKTYQRELEGVMPGSTVEINLTSRPFDLYLEMLTERMRSRGILCD